MSPAPARARVPARPISTLPAPASGSRPALVPVPGRVSRPRPPLRLVDNRRLEIAARRRRARRLLVTSVVLAGASLLALAGTHAVLVSNQVRLDDLEQQVADVQARHQSLRLEVARMEAPERIVTAAVERLGMVPPDAVTYLQPAVGTDPQLDDTPGRPAEAAASDPVGEWPASPWGAVKPYLGSRP